MSTPEGLRVWDAARKLAEEVIEAMKHFRGRDIAKLRSQLASAANSVGANIAEGCGRGTNPEQLHYFRMGRGSLDEVRHHLQVCKGTEGIPADEFKKLWDLSTVTKRMLTSLIVTLERKTPK